MALSLAEIARIINHGTPEERERFSDSCNAYNVLLGACEGINLHLARLCGWQGEEGELYLADYYRFHIEHDPGNVRFMNGGDVLAFFSIDEKGISYVEGPWYPKGADVVDALSDMEACVCSDVNVKAVRQFTWDGKIRASALRYPDGRTVVCAGPAVSGAMRAALEEVIPSVQFVRPQVYDGLVAGAFESAYVESERPLFEIFLYDGRMAASLSEWPGVVCGVPLKDRSAQRRNFEELVRYGNALRTQLQVDSGLDVHYQGKFYCLASAAYPRPEQSRSILSVGTASMDWEPAYAIACVGSKIAVTGYDGEVRRLDSLDAAKDWMRSVVLSKENISAAHDEFLEMGISSDTPDGTSESEKAVQSVSHKI